MNERQRSLKRLVVGVRSAAEGLRERAKTMGQGRNKVTLRNERTTDLKMAERQGLLLSEELGSEQENDTFQRLHQEELAVERQRLIEA